MNGEITESETRYPQPFTLSCPMPLPPQCDQNVSPVSKLLSNEKNEEVMFLSAMLTIHSVIRVQREIPTEREQNQSENRTSFSFNQSERDVILNI